MTRHPFLAFLPLALSSLTLSLSAHAGPLTGKLVECFQGIWNATSSHHYPADLAYLPETGTLILAGKGATGMRDRVVLFDAKGGVTAFKFSRKEYDKQRRAARKVDLQDYLPMHFKVTVPPPAEATASTAPTDPAQSPQPQKFYVHFPAKTEGPAVAIDITNERRKSEHLDKKPIAVDVMKFASGDGSEIRVLESLLYKDIGDAFEKAKTDCPTNDCGSKYVTAIEACSKIPSLENRSNFALSQFDPSRAPATASASAK